MRPSFHSMTETVSQGPKTNTYDIVTQKGTTFFHVFTSFTIFYFRIFLYEFCMIPAMSKKVSHSTSSAFTRFLSMPSITSRVRTPETPYFWWKWNFNIIDTKWGVSYPLHEDTYTKSARSRSDIRRILKLLWPNKFV